MADKKKAEPTELFSNAEFYHVRNCLVEVIEEVKLRRKNDAESDERIRLLVNEKYKLERAFEAEQAKMTVLQEDHQRQLLDMERSFQEKMRLIEEENKQLKIFKKCGEKETDALKDSVRSLQLSKYSLEKNLRDQEHKLQSHLNSSDQQLGEITALEQKIQAMTSLFKTLGTSQDKLANNVSEAVKLNKKLMFVNEHQKCVMELQKTDLHQCQQSLIQLHTQQESPPPDTVELEGLQQHLTELSHQLNIVNEQKKLVETELEEYKTKQKKVLEELHQTHCLVKQHLDNANQHRDRCEELELMLVTLRSKVKDTEDLVDHLNQEIDVEKALRNDTVTKLTIKEETLKEEVKELKQRLESTESAQVVLEELNVQLKESNTKLGEQYQEVKNILDKEKTNKEQQTSISLFQVRLSATQTENITNDDSVQTENKTASASVQTTNEYSISSAQTDQHVYVSSMSQTFVPPLANSSTQTILLCAEDDKISLYNKTQPEVGKYVQDVQELDVIGEIGDDVPQGENHAILAKNNEDGQSLRFCQKESDLIETKYEPAGITVEDEIERDEFQIDTYKATSTANFQCMETNQCETTLVNLSVGSVSTSPVYVETTFPQITPKLKVSMVHLQDKCSTSATDRKSLPISKHDKQSAVKESKIVGKGSGSMKASCELSEVKTLTDIVNNRRGSSEESISGNKRGEKNAKTRFLYSEAETPWGAHLEGDEQKDQESKRSSSSATGSSTSKSLSESWKALLADEEHKKRQLTPGRSPRTRLKMGLKMLTDSSPSRPHKPCRSTLSGLEGPDSDFKEKTKVDKKAYTDVKDNFPKRYPLDWHLPVQRVQKSPMLYQNAVNMRFTSNQVGNSVEKTQVSVRDQQDRPGKGILKSPWSEKIPKSVHFETEETSTSKNLQTTPPSTPLSLNAQPTSRPSGEQLLFSDEDEEKMGCPETPQGQGPDIDQSPVIGLSRKKRKIFDP